MCDTNALADGHNVGASLHRPGELYQEVRIVLQPKRARIEKVERVVQPVTACPLVVLRIRSDIVQRTPILDHKDVGFGAGPPRGERREGVRDDDDRIGALELPPLKKPVVGSDHGARWPQLLAQQLRYGDAVEILDPEHELRAGPLARMDVGRLRLRRRIAGDNDVRLVRMHQFCNRLSVGDIVEPAAHEGRLVVGAGQLHSGKGQAIGIDGRSLEPALRAEVPVEIRVVDFMSANGQFAAEIDLERVPRVVVDEDLHDSRTNLATETWPL